MDYNYNSSHIPGMIEPVEQNLLYGLAKDFNFEPDEVIVEVGSFLGRSCNCLADGVGKNTKANIKNVVHAFDLFSCSTDGSFFDQLKLHLPEDKLDLITIDDRNRRVDFIRAFEHFVRGHISSGRVIAHRSKLTSLDIFAGQIGILHVDAPKFYAEMRYVADVFFTKLRPGSVLIFQDYFYHWSAEIIAFVSLLERAGMITPVRSAASSLVVRCERVFTDALLIELYNSYASVDVSVSIEEAIKNANHFYVDRREIFLTRLQLAKFQWMYENVGPVESTQFLISYLNSDGACLNPTVINDFFDLMMNAFSIKTLYQVDQYKGVSHQ